MSTELIISILGVITAILVSFIGAFLANKNNVILQTKKLKKEHYVAFIEAVHYLASNNSDSNATEKYVFARNKIFIIASEEVVMKMIKYEEEAVGKENDLHDKYLTSL